MAHNEIGVGVAPDEMFALLLDPYSYPKWVVGTRRIREVDTDWPRLGARFHHSVGLGPLSTRDSTRMLASRPPFDLDLEVRFRPLGVARVSLRVSEAGTRRCRIALDEEPTAGPAGGLRGRAWDAVVHARNALSLWRLRRLAESRQGEPGRPGSFEHIGSSNS
jgi:Polyketide cyclase / dehydrase and lipid transport